MPRLVSRKKKNQMNLDMSEPVSIHTQQSSFGPISKERSILIIMLHTQRRGAEGGGGVGGWVVVHKHSFTHAD